MAWWSGVWTWTVLSRGFPGQQCWVAFHCGETHSWSPARHVKRPHSSLEWPRLFTSAFSKGKNKLTTCRRRPPSAPNTFLTSYIHTRQVPRTEPNPLTDAVAAPTDILEAFCTTTGDTVSWGSTASKRLLGFSGPVWANDKGGWDTDSVAFYCLPSGFQVFCIYPTNAWRQTALNRFVNP